MCKKEMEKERKEIWIKWKDSRCEYEEKVEKIRECHFRGLVLLAVTGDSAPVSA